MDFLAYAAAVALFALLFLLRRSKTERGGFAGTLERLQKAGFSFDRQAQDAHGRFLLLADTEKRRWLLLERNQTAPARPSDFATLLGFAVFEDHRPKRIAGAGFAAEADMTGRALVRVSQNTCSMLEIRLHLAAGRAAHITLPLLESETPKRSLTYESAQTAAREIVSLLEEILRPAE